MGKQSESFAEKVRRAFAELINTGVREVTLKHLFIALDLASKKDKRPLYSTLRDFARYGEIEEAGAGVYIYKGKGQGVQVRERIWAVMRMRKTFTYEDLQELAGAAKGYVKEFVTMLVKRGAVERVQAIGRGSYLYRLVEDSGPATPEDDEKSARLRRIREAKRAAIDLIEASGKDLIEASRKLMAARIKVNDIPEVCDGNE